MRFKVIIAILVLIASPIVSSKVFRISGHPNYPPFSWEYKGKMYGIGIELSQMILKELKLEHDVKHHGPWKRVQYLAKHGDVDVIAAIYSNNERQLYLDYPAPYMLNPISIFVKKGSEFKFEGRDDLKGLSGVSMHGDSFGEDIDRFIETHLKVHRVTDPEVGLKLVFRGRADYFLWGYYPCKMSTIRHGMSDIIIPLPLPIGFENMHLAFSKKSGMTQHLPKISRVIKRLIKRGILKSLDKKYTALYEAQIESGI